ncbi:MAG: succinate dehydrogenase, hydrophobic membrane anchor protein [Alphaproteobacteria bacterium]|nr:succinate dehydrogenase, hydrophobic membrane anchor protein [Alphaproteobacteria bacterium]MDP7223181.1 succinate dehydrogenase, hydrophobic membrane anchor protein [Alphaproteobacteria bacterium]
MKLKWEESGLKAPLARAKGLGSAKEGSEHWFMQRVTAISNLILMAWLIWSVIHHVVGASHADFTAWLAAPVNAILMILAVISVFYHAALGTQVITEDYVHHEGLKMIKLIGIKLFFFGAAVACIFSIMKVAFGG